jgi:hypothetical protein
METYDRPCAAPGLTSYRYRGAYGWIMIGAIGHADALREAARSLSDKRHAPTLDRLEIWTGDRYAPCAAPTTSET